MLSALGGTSLLLLLGITLGIDGTAESMGRAALQTAAQAVLLAVALTALALRASLPGGAIHIGIEGEHVALVDHRHHMLRGGQHTLWRCGPVLGIGAVCLLGGPPLAPLFTPDSAARLHTLWAGAARLGVPAMLLLMWQARHPLALAVLGLPVLLLWFALIA
jgi:hypothetical protein